MKIYRGGNQGGHAASPHLVTVTEGDTVAMLAHHVRHSPTGFSWGYGGSGPADLARSLLWDYLGAEPAPSCYQAFKSDYVSRWPQGGDWTLAGDELAEWLADWQSQGRHATVAEYERSFE